MKEYLEKGELLHYLRDRVEMAECVVNEDTLTKEEVNKHYAVIFDRKDLIPIIEGMKSEDPYKKIIDRIEELISYYQNRWGYGTSNFVNGQIFAYKDLLKFIKKLSEGKEDDNK